MKIYKYIALTLLPFFHNCYSQEIRQNTTGFKLSPKERILYIVTYPGKSPVATENLIINSSDIDSLYILPFSKSDDICRIMNIGQVWVVKPRLFLTFFNIIDVFNRYNIDKSRQHLPIRVDNWDIDAPETLIIEESEIIGVKIFHDTNDKFISIETRHPLIRNRQ